MEAVYCICRQPQDERFMIQCDKCDEWFHGDCVGVSEDDNLQSFICASCKLIQVVTETGKSPQKKRKRRKKLTEMVDELHYWVNAPKIRISRIILNFEMLQYNKTHNNTLYTL